MGGVWERLIGVVRRIFDFMLLENFMIKGYLIYEVLVIFFVEVMVIINLCLLVILLMDFDDLYLFSLLFLII